MTKHLDNLKRRNFHKLIVGAALKDFQSIEDYSYYFTHAQADVIDISAFPHSVVSAQKGIDKAINENPSLKQPLIMVSVNIGKDPHFRRIELDKDSCTSCQACIPTCPSEAFSFTDSFAYDIDLCFGCANCLAACKDDALNFQIWDAFDSKSLTELIKLGASAIEIHLNQDLEAFETFYQELPAHFKLESFCIGSETSSQKELEKAVDSIIELSFRKHHLKHQFIIQVDGIPLSGAKEIKEKDQASINKAKLVIDYISNKYPAFKKNIFVQIAGGTSENSLQKALDQKIAINGVAIGSYARKKLKLAKNKTEAINIAKDLVNVCT